MKLIFSWTVSKKDLSCVKFYKIEYKIKEKKFESSRRTKPSYDQNSPIKFWVSKHHMNKPNLKNLSIYSEYIILDKL